MFSSPERQVSILTSQTVFKKYGGVHKPLCMSPIFLPSNMHGLQLCTQHALINGKSFVPPNAEFANNHLLRTAGCRAASVNRHSLFIFTTPRGRRPRREMSPHDSTVDSQNIPAGRSHKNTTLPLISASFGTSLQSARLHKHRASSQT